VVKAKREKEEEGGVRKEGGRFGVRDGALLFTCCGRSRSCADGWYVVIIIIIIFFSSNSRNHKDKDDDEMMIMMMMRRRTHHPSVTGYWGLWPIRFK